MQVRKLKSGRFVAELHFRECDALYAWLVSFLESENKALLFEKLDKEENFKRVEHYYAVAHFLTKYHHKLVSVGLNTRITMRPLEAFTLLYFLWSKELPMGFLDMANGRSQLHQLLS